jgi:hypothetical protein
LKSVQQRVLQHIVRRVGIAPTGAQQRAEHFVAVARPEPIERLCIALFGSLN